MDITIDDLIERYNLFVKINYRQLYIGSLSSYSDVEWCWFIKIEQADNYNIRIIKFATATMDNYVYIENPQDLINLGVKFPQLTTIMKDISNWLFSDKPLLA